MKMKSIIAKVVIVYLILVGITSRGEEGTKADVQRIHWAFASDIGYLDGLKMEALGNGNGNGALSTTDSEGNLYLIWKYDTRWLRCVRVDGIVETIAGDDRWPGNLKLRHIFHLGQCHHRQVGILYQELSLLCQDFH